MVRLDAGGRATIDPDTPLVRRDRCAALGGLATTFDATALRDAAARLRVAAGRACAAAASIRTVPTVHRNSGS